MCIINNMVKSCMTDILGLKRVLFLKRRMFLSQFCFRQWRSFFNWHTISDDYNYDRFFLKVLKSIEVDMPLCNLISY